MRSSLIFVLMLPLAGCIHGHARGQVSESLSPCARDLVLGSYAAGANDEKRESNAEAYCAKYTPSEIAHAKELVDKGYTKQFRHAIEKVAGVTDAEYQCAIAEHERTHPTGFSINASCKGATAQ